MNQEVIYVPTSDRCNLHEVALSLLMEIFQTKNKASVLRAWELRLRTIHILALGLRGVLREEMNLPMSNIERIAKGDHVGLKMSDDVNLVLNRTWKGNETKLFREKYESKFHMSGMRTARGEMRLILQLLRRRKYHPVSLCGM